MTGRRTLRESVAHAATPREWKAPMVVVWTIILIAATISILARARSWGAAVFGVALWAAIVGYPWTRSVLRWRRVHRSGTQAHLDT